MVSSSPVSSQVLRPERIIGQPPYSCSFAPSRSWSCVTVKPAGVADGLDVPGDPRRAFGFHLVAPERDHALDELARWIDFEDLALAEQAVGLGGAHLEAPAGLPVRGDPHAEVVLAPDLGVGDRLPEALRGGADVNLEDLFHGALQSALEAAECGRPGFRVLAHPPVVDEPDRDGVQEVELFPAAASGHDQAGFLELLEVLHHAEAADAEACLERAERLPVLTEELVEEAAPRRVGQCLEHFVHAIQNR